MTDAVAHDAELDASGLNCPLPLLKAKMELNRLASGAVLKVIATDALIRHPIKDNISYP